MNYKIMGRFIAQILTIEGLFMLPALSISLFFGEWNAVQGFLAAILAIAVTAAVLFTLCRKAATALNAREGMVCVGISWIILSLYGCLPFVISGEIPRFVDAFFEIVSGFTTTGSSILADVEALSWGILYWRSFSHWLCWCFCLPSLRAKRTRALPCTCFGQKAPAPVLVSWCRECVRLPPFCT